MKTTSFSVILIFISCSLFAQEIEISGELLSKKDQSPIPYASIIDITTYKAGTTSNEKGEFILRLPKSATNHKVLFSSIGYNDTILSVQSLLKVTSPILLIQDIQVLKEVVVTKKGYKELDIGTPFGEVIDYNIGSSSPGAFFGSYFKIKNNHQGVLKSVSLCLSEDGFPSAPFLVRLLAPKEKINPNQIQSLSKFTDLLKKPVIIEGKEAGWLEIDLSKDNIALPNHGVYFLVIPMDNGNDYKWETQEGKEKFGIAVSTYQDKQKNVFTSLMMNGGISYSNLTFVQYLPMAMALTYLTER